MWQRGVSGDRRRPADARERGSGRAQNRGIREYKIEGLDVERKMSRGEEWPGRCWIGRCMSRDRGDAEEKKARSGKR